MLSEPHHLDAILPAKLEANFDAVIRSRVAVLVEEHHLELPHLTESVIGENQAGWFPVPGMYGGFKYWLAERGTDAVLVTESWCRIAGGSGQRHEVRPEAWSLVAEGFI